MTSQLLNLLRRNPIRREDVDAAVSLLLPLCGAQRGSQVVSNSTSWTDIKSLFLKVGEVDSCDIGRLLSRIYINPCFY